MLCPTLWDLMDCTMHGILQGRILSLLQGIFPTQGSNPGLLHCRQILYQLSLKGSPYTISVSCFSWLDFKIRLSWKKKGKRTGAWDLELKDPALPVHPTLLTCCVSLGTVLHCSETFFPALQTEANIALLTRWLQACLGKYLVASVVSDSVQHYGP